MNAEASRTPAAPLLGNVPQGKNSREGAPAALVSLANRFAAQLEKQGGAADKAAEQPRSASTLSGSLATEQKPLTAKEDRSDGQGEWAGAGSSGALSFASATPVAAARGEVALPGTALLDRIAAQIAEPRGPQLAQPVQLALPAGSLAEGAIIMRAPDGGLAIRITGLDPRLAPQQTLRLRSGLERALARRGVEVSSLQLDPAELSGDQRGRAAVTSRVV